MEVDKLKEREKNLQYFDDFLKIVADKRCQNDHKTKLIKSFWANQVAEVRKERNDDRQLDKDLLDTERRKEMETEDDLVIHIFCSRFWLQPSIALHLGF